MKFHPLADLFPLMEGAEFDELAASIKANGLREEITLFNGAILDGRNRYLACEKVGVEPRFEEFAGDDPHAFVADKNIHRRHLKENQRALIAASMANMGEGRPWPKVTDDISPVKITATRAAELLNVSRSSVINAKRVLREGTPEEIQAIRSGTEGLSTLAKQISKKVSKEERLARRGRGLSATGKNPDRIHAQQLNAQIWADFRNALIALTNLPKPVDVARIARGNDKRTATVDAYLFKATQYLKEFCHEWSKRNEATGQDGSDTDDHADAGTGN